MMVSYNVLCCSCLLLQAFFTVDDIFQPQNSFQLCIINSWFWSNSLSIRGFAELFWLEVHCHCSSFSWIALAWVVSNAHWGKVLLLIHLLPIYSFDLHGVIVTWCCWWVIVFNLITFCHLYLSWIFHLYFIVLILFIYWNFEDSGMNLLFFLMYTDSFDPCCGFWCNVISPFFVIVNPHHIWVQIVAWMG